MASSRCAPRGLSHSLAAGHVKRTGGHDDRHLTHLSGRPGTHQRSASRGQAQPACGGGSSFAPLHARNASPVRPARRPARDQASRHPDGTNVIWATVIARDHGLIAVSESAHLPSAGYARSRQASEPRGRVRALRHGTRAFHRRGRGKTYFRILRVWGARALHSSNALLHVGELDDDGADGCDKEGSTRPTVETPAMRSGR